MFAVIKTGGKQYRVAADDKITVMSLLGEPGEQIIFDQVLMLTDGAATQVGSPLVEGASVGGEIIEQARGPKVYAFKKRRRKNSKRKRGHRQDLTLVRITGFGVGGAAPTRVEKAAAAHEATPAEAHGEGASTAHVEAPAEASGRHDVGAHHEQAAAQEPTAEQPKPE